MVWAFADITISTNLARDLGPRIVAAIFYGGEAFSYMNYSWIAILVNIPATLFAGKDSHVIVGTIEDDQLLTVFRFSDLL